MSEHELLLECRKKLLSDIKPECWAGTAALIERIDCAVAKQASAPHLLWELLEKFDRLAYGIPQFTVLSENDDGHARFEVSTADYKQLRALLDRHLAQPEAAPMVDHGTYGHAIECAYHCADCIKSWAAHACEHGAKPEAAPVAEEPKWWLVIDETGEPTYGSTFRSMSNQHINDALDHHEIEGAKDWHLVPAYASPPSAPDRPDVPVARVTESTGTMTVVLVLEPNLPVGTLLYAGSAPDWALVEELKQIIADADADGDVRAIQFSMQTIDRIIAALESKP